MQSCHAVVCCDHLSIDHLLRSGAAVRPGRDAHRRANTRALRSMRSISEQRLSPLSHTHTHTHTHAHVLPSIFSSLLVLCENNAQRIELFPERRTCSSTSKQRRQALFFSVASTHRHTSTASWHQLRKELIFSLHVTHKQGVPAKSRPLIQETTSTHFRRRPTKVANTNNENRLSYL